MCLFLKICFFTSSGILVFKMITSILLYRVNNFLFSTGTSAGPI